MLIINELLQTRQSNDNISATFIYVSKTH